MDNPNAVLMNSSESPKTSGSMYPVRLGEYKCQLCSLVLPRLHSLRVHLRDVHKENSFLCEICGEKQASRALLKVHTQSHRIFELVTPGTSSVSRPRNNNKAGSMRRKSVKRKICELVVEVDPLQIHPNDEPFTQHVVGCSVQGVPVRVWNPQELRAVSHVSKTSDNFELQRLEADSNSRPSVLRYSETESSEPDNHGGRFVTIFKQEVSSDICEVTSDTSSTLGTEEVSSNDIIEMASFPVRKSVPDSMITEVSDIVKVEVPKMVVLDDAVLPTVYQEPERIEGDMESHASGQSPVKNEVEYVVENSLKCSLCQETFPDEISLVTHESLHDAFEQTEEQTDDSDDVEDLEAVDPNNDYLSKLKGSGEFTCEQCPQSFPRQHLLKVHAYAAHGEHCFTCQICAVKCPTRQSLTKHKQVHVIDGAFKCETCGFSQAKYSNFLRHLKLHSGTKDYTCEWCGRSFTTSTVLIRHRRRHTGEKPYSCKECGERFARLYGLKVHQSKHVGRSYNCTEENCTKAFYSKSALNNHLKSHLPERPYKCVACGCGFYMSSHYKDHLRKHTGEKPFVCNVCSKAFARKAELVVHHRTHTGEKPFVCPHCDRAFAQKSALKHHLQTHTRIKEHQCSECDRVFKHKGALKRHIKCAHVKDDSELSGDSFSFYLSDDLENERDSPDDPDDPDCVADTPKSTVDDLETT